MSLFDDDFNDDHDAYDETICLPQIEGNSLKPAKDSSYFIGHEAVEADILRLWHSDKMPHAIILNGLSGVGKMTFAYRLARFILKQSSQNNSDSLLFGDAAALAPDSLSMPTDDPVFQKTASGGHPDFKVIRRPFDEKKSRYKDEIPVDTIRSVAPFLRKTSSDGGWRIVIIDDANMMNRNGQNALLKILEEPPRNALLLLVTHGAGGLLPTIRSRCRFISFEPLDDADIRELILSSEEAKSVSSNDIDLVIALSDGSAGHALRLLQGTELNQIRLLLNTLNDVQTLSALQMDSLALSFGKSGDSESIDNFIYVVQWWFETIIRMVINAKKIQTIGAIDIQKPPNSSLASILRLQENVAEHIETCINGAIDKRYMIYKALRLIHDR